MNVYVVDVTYQTLNAWLNINGLKHDCSGEETVQKHDCIIMVP